MFQLTATRLLECSTWGCLNICIYQHEELCIDFEALQMVIETTVKGTIYLQICEYRLCNQEYTTNYHVVVIMCCFSI